MDIITLEDLVGKHAARYMDDNPHLDYPEARRYGLEMVGAGWGIPEESLDKYREIERDAETHAERYMREVPEADYHEAIRYGKEKSVFDHLGDDIGSAAMETLVLLGGIALISAVILFLGNSSSLRSNLSFYDP